MACEEVLYLRQLEDLEDIGGRIRAGPRVMLILYDFTSYKIINYPYIMNYHPRRPHHHVDMILGFLCTENLIELFF